MELNLDTRWQILQDVHDNGEELGLPVGIELTALGHQLSEWEPLRHLRHLQLELENTPYWGRRLRYFNDAPWWYLNEFEFADSAAECVTLSFTNVDYFCRVWLNGEYLGEHEGYATPFSFDITGVIRHEATNRLVVKVWSPWDSEIEKNAPELRTFRVKRDLVKGTYEHDDTLIARDVNPVGIYGTVRITSTRGARFDGEPRVSYELDMDARQASVCFAGELAAAPDAKLELELVHLSTGKTIAHTATRIAEGAFAARFDAHGVRLWTTWDRGHPHLYELRVTLDGVPQRPRRMGFRRVTLDRTPGRTAYSLNGHPLYVRGTSYFPDVYVSSLSPQRYRRDLLAIKAAGFNVIRVHVHVELDSFYDLCDELGIALLQDSEYNWTHPVSDAWAERMVRIYSDTILMLEDHPSLITWICLNEPGVADVLFDGTPNNRAMEVSPGPALVDAVTALDPSRPLIKGSYCEDDPLSGDSHNYLGSLHGGEYTEIDGTTEKLNTEFGVDAPGIRSNLEKEPDLERRLGSLLDGLEPIQEYQYRLLKHYIEHYRLQKDAPNTGYVQFMFIDLSPQSFYGVYDWWGVPKRGLDALSESNQPTAVMLRVSSGRADSLWFVNDTGDQLPHLVARWSLRDGTTGALLDEGESVPASCGPDGIVRLATMSIAASETPVSFRVSVFDGADRVIAENRYERLFDHPRRLEGHPDRMSHELGMRLYHA
ncbi:MAG: hypothetical protein J0I43_03680 [Microbacterium sp.]|nr:hypothetical protein [Microbacterium sp.]